jgi:hypothetical protein
VIFFVAAEPISRKSLDEVIHVVELLIRELSHSADENGDSDFAEDIALTPECLPTAAIPEHAPLTSLPVTPPPTPEPTGKSASGSETSKSIKRSMSDAESEKEVCVAGLSAR